MKARLDQRCWLTIGSMCDLLWSDPDDAPGWALSPRGAGWLFGPDVAKAFNHRNNISFIARAHQLVLEGYKEMFEGGVVTVWSAPNYCYRCGNVASILEVSETGGRNYKIFDAANQEMYDSHGQGLWLIFRRGLPSKRPVAEYFL